MLEFRILGPLEVLKDGAPVQLSGRNQRALLTLLLLRANEAVSTERLVDQLWGEHPPRTATTSLQNAVSQLRKLLEPDLQLHTRAAGYLLELDAGQLDLSSFERLAREANAAEPAARALLLREALALWRGPALADSEMEEFAQAEIHRLEDLRLGVLEQRIQADLDTGLDAALISELETLIGRHPLRERLRAQLMLALFRSGRQADALNAYHDARRTLDELGIEPRLVPVLGPGAGSIADGELARLLAERFELSGQDRGLAFISQAVAARNGVGPLHDELRLALGQDAEPAPLHAWLAAVPPLLRSRGLPHQLIVSTSFDTGVELAFEAAGEELDVVVYVASGRDRGKFLHIAPDGGATVVHEPNAYTGLALEERTALLKIHGHVDRGETRERESFAVSEDDHIDYLVGGDATGAIPVQLAARLRRSHLLFLGYALDDWSLRVFLRRVWGGDRLAYRSWAVQPAAEQVASELWRERGAEVYNVSLQAYAEELNRLTATLEETVA
jgi:DNA-binding SARP family transcriptional activator